MYVSVRPPGLNEDRWRSAMIFWEGHFLFLLLSPQDISIDFPLEPLLGVESGAEVTVRSIYSKVLRQNIY